MLRVRAAKSHARFTLPTRRRCWTSCLTATGKRRSISYNRSIRWRSMSWIETEPGKSLSRPGYRIRPVVFAERLPVHLGIRLVSTNGIPTDTYSQMSK